MTGNNMDRWSISGPLWAGSMTIVLLLGGFGGWSVLTQISGAVISPGQIEVESNRQVIQHPEGGIVDRILIDEGAAVQAGDLMVVLDGAEMTSALTLLDAQIMDLQARQARLLAERDGNAAVRFADDLVSGGVAAQDVMDGQDRLFAARVATIRSKTEQMTRQRHQISAQVTGLHAQQAALTTQRDLVTQELEDQQSLLGRGLAQTSRVSALQRDRAELSGRIGQVMAEAAMAAERITEIDIRIASLTSDRREEAITQLRDLQVSLLDLTERRRILQHRIDRLEIRAPVSGIVYGLQVFAPQTVIQPADPLLYLVPQDRPRVITTRVEVTDIDQVLIGQQTHVRFPTFDQRRTPDLIGRVTQISADAYHDPQTGTPFYRAEVALDRGEIERLPADMVLIPGMPVEVFIATGARAPLTYLIKPLSDYFARAFRES